MDLSLREAGETDIPLISALADTIWHQHYPSIIGLSQVRYMLGRMYNAQSLLEQMRSKGHRFFIVETDKAAGFLSVEVRGKGEVFLHKFYIDQLSAGKGLGSAALTALLQLMKPVSIRLTVNRQNYKSINFYFKNGFIIESVADFDIGEGYVMNDFVMVWDRDR